MGLCDPQNGPFPVFARISRVWNLAIGPKFHRLSVSWPYSCVKSLKKVGHSSPEIYLGTRMSHFLQSFHTAVWPGDGQSVKFWAGSKLPNSRYPCKHRKGAFLGVTKAHISGLECPTFFKLFTQLYGQETDNR